jgi:hypothetical protein
MDVDTFETPDNPAVAGEVTVHWENLYDLFRRFIREAEEPITLIAPFIDPGILRRLMSERHVALVVTSWRPSHLLQGVSSLDTYAVTREFGAKLVVNDRLHAKVATGNFKHTLLGSANITAPGLGFCSPSNLEAVLEFRTPSRELNALFCRMLIDGRSVDEALYRSYVEWLETADKETPNHIVPPILLGGDHFLISQLPATSSPSQLWTELRHAASVSDMAIHDLQLFRVAPRDSLEAFRDELRAKWLTVPFIARLTREIDQEAHGLYFGRIKALIHQISEDVPLPHRRDLTTLVQNFYTWIAELLPDEYEVSRPSYSQLLRRRTDT